MDTEAKTDPVSYHFWKRKATARERELTDELALVGAQERSEFLRERNLPQWTRGFRVRRSRSYRRRERWVVEATSNRGH